MRFTDKGIQGLKARATRYEIVEDGATGLAVRVSPRGVKTFCYLFRHDGKPKRLTLGLYLAPIAEPLARPSDRSQRGLPYLGLADARVRLAEARKLRDSGVNPGVPALALRHREKKAETIGELIDAYIEKYATPNKKATGAYEDKRQLNKDVRPAWGTRKASSITRQDIVDLLDEVVARGAPVAANRLHAVVRKMFGWAVRRGIVTASPATEIDAPGGKEKSRKRVLLDAEIGEVWAATKQLGALYGPLQQLLLVTGQRRSEVAGIRRKTELDMAAKLWTIPGTRTKNKLDHEVPLPPMAIEILKPRLASMGDDADCVFSSGRKGDVPVSGFKGAKQRLGKLILEARKEKRRLAGLDPGEAEPMPHWTLHDLRRTMRTHLSKLRLDPEICERVINHVPAGVRKTYDLHEYRDEKREVLNAWSAHLRRIINAKPAAGGKVVRLRRVAQ
jgi:integrase